MADSPDSPDKTVIDSPPPMRSESAPRALYRHPAAIVAAVAFVLLAWQWYDSRQQIHSLQGELAQRLAAADSEAKQSRGVAEQVRESS